MLKLPLRLIPVVKNTPQAFKIGPKGTTTNINTRCESARLYNLNLLTNSFNW
jgi:hypothetical protein